MIARLRRRATLRRMQNVLWFHGLNRDSINPRVQQEVWSNDQRRVALTRLATGQVEAEVRIGARVELHYTAEGLEAAVAR